MSKYDIKREPHHVRNQPDVWWYEHESGFEIHVHQNAINPNTKQVVFTIDHGIIKRALKRRDKER